MTSLFEYRLQNRHYDSFKDEVVNKYDLRLLFSLCFVRREAVKKQRQKYLKVVKTLAEGEMRRTKTNKKRKRVGGKIKLLGGKEEGRRRRVQNRLEQGYGWKSISSTAFILPFFLCQCCYFPTPPSFLFSPQKTDRNQTMQSKVHMKQVRRVGSQVKHIIFLLLKTQMRTSRLELNLSLNQIHQLADLLSCITAFQYNHLIRPLPFLQAPLT